MEKWEGQLARREDRFMVAKTAGLDTTTTASRKMERWSGRVNWTRLVVEWNRCRMTGEAFAQHTWADESFWSCRLVTSANRVNRCGNYMLHINIDEIQNWILVRFRSVRKISLAVIHYVMSGFNFIKKISSVEKYRLRQLLSVHAKSRQYIVH